ncbi:WcaI family glycosyltransferase [Kineosporia sp. A_224]|uniref:WcaI family glycosyltransferase n=1 Tax=Kineosporia sp. A_224 TaxID=1962180 RepID=UPI000B4AB876|nr:WcaI family glycosyltransferase [Kineosporia sp. A_224]
MSGAPARVTSPPVTVGPAAPADRLTVGVVPQRTAPDALAVRAGRAGRHPLTDRHALVVGINYAPEPTGIAPYTTGLAEHLAQHAASVTVLTGVPHYPQWRVPAAYRWRFRFSEQSKLPNDAGLLMQRMRHYVPTRQTAMTRAAYELTFLANAWATRVRHAPAVVVGVTPSLGGAIAAARLARRHGAKLVIVVQDLMAKAAAQSGISGGGRAATATAALERYALTQADRVLVVSEAFRAQVREYGVPDERISVLPNWSHVSPTDVAGPAARAALGWPAEPFTVVHTGNIGLKQDLGNIVEAARLARADPGLRFVIVGDGSQRSAVQHQAAGLPNVAFVDPLDTEQYPLALSAADVLVVNERPGVADMSLPSKLTSYFTSGRPVLAAVGTDGATARELARTGGAALVVAPGDPSHFVAGVRKLHADDTLCHRMGTIGRDYAERTLGYAAAMTRLDAVLEGLFP